MGQGLRQALQRMGHAVLLATNDQALEEMLRRRPDLILAAPDLIELDGRRIFAGEPRRPAPVLMPLPSMPQAKGDPPAHEDALEGTTCTPEHMRLANRVIRHLRSLVRKETSRIRVGDLTILFDKKQVLFHAEPILLTPLQFKLLGVLALHAGRVLGPGELLESVWGYKAEDTEARELLKVHIRRLRQKMHAISPEGKDYIQSVRGFGYRLAAPRKTL